VIVLLRAAPRLASGPWRLPKPCHDNACSGCHRARTRSAQRIAILFRCMAGLVRSVLDQVRPEAGVFRIRSYPFRSRGWQLGVDLAISRAEPPSSCAVTATSDADMGKDGAILIKVGHDQGKDARDFTRLWKATLNRSVRYQGQQRNL